MIPLQNMGSFKMGKVSSIITCRLTESAAQSKPTHNKLNTEHDNSRHGGRRMWSQVYNPFGSMVLSTLVAAICRSSFCWEPSASST